MCNPSLMATRFDRKFAEERADAVGRSVVGSGSAALIPSLDDRRALLDGAG